MRLFAFLIALTFTQVGFAQQPAAEPSADPDADLDASELDEAARLLFESASRAYEAGNFTDALARYTNAYQLSGRAPLLYNIAICHDRLDQKAEAADYYERFVAEVPDSPRVGIARSRGEILRASLEADGQTTDVETQDAETQENSETSADVTPAEPSSSRSLAGPIASLAVGGAGLVTFVVAGLISSSRLSAAEATCTSPMGDGCSPDELDGVDRASLVADIGLGLAIAGTAVGVVWLLVGGDDEPDESAARFSPIASPNELGAQVMGSF